MKTHTPLTDEQKVANGKQIVADLRRVQADAQQALEEFTRFVDHIETATRGASHLRADYFTSTTLARRVREEIDDLTYLHKGSTAGGHVRDALEHVIESVGGEDIAR